MGSARIWRLITLGVFLAVLGLGMQASAQQPAPINPTASAAKEEQLLQQLRSVEGRVTIPDERANVLIQPAGRDWRSFHQNTLLWVGGIAILGMIVVLAVFYVARGAVRIEAGRSGVRILRFSAIERFVHWLTASCFIVLALSGLNITFGKWLILPWLGPEAFTGLSLWAKYAHNYLAFPFMLGLIFTFVVWIKDNMPNRTDAEWLKRGGGMVGNDHPPAKRFNAGQKLIYWAVIIGGLLLSVTGVILLFPFSGTTIANMQLAQIIHAVIAVLLIAVMIAHIYIGTMGMEGAYDAMGTGEVDLNWAKQHHSLWVEEEKSRSQPAGDRKVAMPAE
jgi:formate dehydrogenase subunit gamma